MDYRSRSQNPRPQTTLSRVEPFNEAATRRYRIPDTTASLVRLYAAAPPKIEITLKGLSSSDVCGELQTNIRLLGGKVTEKGSYPTIPIDQLDADWAAIKLAVLDHLVDAWRREHGSTST